MKGIIGFVIGAGCGSLITWAMLKKKYEAIAQEEIDSVKAVYKSALELSKESDGENVDEESVEDTEQACETAYTPTEEDKEEMENIIENWGYMTEPQKGESGAGHPYIITPEEFSSMSNFYDKISLTLHADGTITDEDRDEIYTLPEIDNMVGVKNIDSIGEFEKGVLYVRNDILQTDYEIIEDDE